MTWWVVTGGIGCGKSTVTRLASAAGYSTIDADLVGHDVLAGPARSAVEARWPEVMKGGQVDRKALGAIVFSDRGQLKELESITHPLISEELRYRMAATTRGVLELSVPIALAGNLPTVVVDVPDEIRRRRLRERGLSEEDIDGRIANQPTREEWLAMASVVIDNSGDPDDLHRAVTRFLRFIFQEDP
ncbi:MAG: dephospho-CoA kinase [Actinomycetota bacterium]